MVDFSNAGEIPWNAELELLPRSSTGMCPLFFLLPASVAVALKRVAAFAISIPTRIYQIKGVPDAAHWIQAIKKQMDRYMLLF